MYRSSRRLSVRRSQLKQKIIVYGLVIIIGFIIVGFLGSFALFAYFSRDLPSPGKLSQTNTGYSTTIYDRDGKVLYELYKDKNRIPTTIDQIPKYLQQATVSIEDKTFYQHTGFSETGILRAFINLLLHRGFEGGSTITQQLIKNVLLTSQQTLTRKIKEVILATEVEKRYSKEQILEMYLNEAPYGGTYWGVGSASLAYFGKPVKDLTLTQSAILAGLPQNPSSYSPFISTKESWRGRTKDVLRRMREDGYITKDQENQSLTELESIHFTSPKAAIQAPHFVFYVKDQIEQQFGSSLIDQGIKVKTTLSLAVQQKVELIVKDEIEKLKDAHVGNGAVVVLDSNTGEILAMVGSYDYNNPDYGNFNAALGQRQPGSSIKPITYALALEKGYTAATMIMDTKTVFPNQGSEDYVPVNYDGKFRGPVQLRFTLGNSLNLPSVKLLAMTGIRDMLEKADLMGIHSLAPTADNIKRFGLAVTLGGGESTLLDMTSAYTVFASGGVKRDTSSITEITDYSGKSIYKAVRSKEKTVFSPGVAFLISHILTDNNARIDEFGPSSYLVVPGKTVAVKTGTTNDKRDNWTIGYTKSLTVGVWVGNNDNSPMNKKIASGVTGASPIWNKVMKELLKTYPDGIMDKPDKVKAVTIDAYLGGLPKDGYPTRTEYFIEGTEPKEIASYYKKLKISRSNGKLANDIEIRSGNYDEKDFIVLSENDPISSDGKNRWQDGINEWASQQSDTKYKPPTDTSTESADKVIVQIKSPGDKSTINLNTNIPIKVKVTSLIAIAKVEIYINGTLKKTVDGDNKDINESIEKLDDGVYELKVIAKTTQDKSGDSTIKFGVNKPVDGN